MGTVNGQGASEVAKSKTAENTVIFSLDWGSPLCGKIFPIVKWLIEAVDDDPSKNCSLSYAVRHQV